MIASSCFGFSFVTFPDILATSWAVPFNPSKPTLIPGNRLIRDLTHVGLTSAVST
jgi:hypothetical protein